MSIVFETIQDLLAAMRGHGARNVYAKVLAANDNSKQQVYFGGGFAAINIFPHGEITYEDGPAGGAVRARNHATLDFAWLGRDALLPAPDAKLILYPRYPEVRFSGFLRGCAGAPGDLMGVGRRIPGRVLFLGVLASGRVIGHVVGPDHPVAAEFADIHAPSLGVFADLTAFIPGAIDPKRALIDALDALAARGWVPSVKLDRQGVPQPYQARNGAGYTLEAALGINPNGNAEPDFHGWEVKQFAVADIVRPRSTNAVTLMTPEPDGGLYHRDLPAFMARYGYADRNGVEGRINFGGIYKVGMERHALTGLVFDLSGFDARSGKITDEAGAIRLLDAAGEVAASWSFWKLLQHWERKHARAAYVPCAKREPPPEYRFARAAELYVGTDFIRLLKAFAIGAVYLDPALKCQRTEAGFGPIHRRCQFRVRHPDLAQLYEAREVVA